ncbi:hypothetical protein HPB50_026021 [Hyalomma asiaticum]|uniref:Uncharacterized protein n=1 Tax=Hyalomma asiaticum TaxID=266040 RepID=A0ACB7TPJ5_HYAAI|nr:hypothetical protein HPB50_026021 [Hyalomma asiaticum]
MWLRRRKDALQQRMFGKEMKFGSGVCGSNLVGKFTTSVKKFVQDVEFDHTREGAVQTSERLFMAEQKVSESYQTVKCALIKLHERYEASKAERNIVHRYALFKVGAFANREDGLV